MWALGAFGLLPRVKRSTKGEGHERRYFYGSVWAVAVAQPVLWLLWKVVPATRARRWSQARGLHRQSSWSSATCRVADCCRARARSCRASGPFRTSECQGDGGGSHVTATIDALTSPTLKHLREAWWDDVFTEFLAETLKPRSGNRILDVGCGEGLAEVALGRLHISQVRLVGVDLVVAKVLDGESGNGVAQSTSQVRRRRRVSPAVSRRRLRFDLLRRGPSARQRC